MCPSHPGAEHHAGMLWSHSHLPESQGETEQTREEENMFHLHRRNKENCLVNCSVMPSIAGEGKKSPLSQLAP